MNLLDLVVKITCDDQASGQVSGIGSKITGILGTAAKVGGAAVVALGTATIALGKTALDAYADYEQLVGGIDTLFKNSSGKMQQYASDAYKTAGVSANRYMEISTSFAAALINSLGGDTAAAADMANMAIMDMSDNANKMGTSLEVVQEAYQSLARGNYEMLDSLKLGYGGTKTELERLLSDAEQIAASQGMVRDYSVDSYSDIVEAIHLVQDEMGITGTTAKEAATTISGSINTAKAAWDNWLAGLGNENADMEGLTDQLVQSVITAGENIIPRAGRIMVNLGNTIASYAPEVGAKLFNALMAVLPESVSGPIRSAVDAGSEALSTLGDAFSGAVDSGLELFRTTVDGAAQVLDAMGQAAQEYLVPALATLGPAFDQLFTALQPLVTALTPVVEIIGVGLVQAISILVTGFGQIVGAIATVITWVTQFVAGVMAVPGQIGTAVTGIITWFSSLPGQIYNFLSMVISNVVAWVGEMIGNADRAGSEFVSNVVNFLTSLPGRVAGFLSSVISRVSSWVGDMASKASSAASRFASNLINGLKSIPGKVVSIGGDIIRGMVDGVVDAAGMLIDAVGGAVNDAISWAKGLLGIASPSKVFREMFGYVMEGAELGVDDNRDLPARALGRAIGEMESVPAPMLTGPVAAAAGAYGGTVYNVYIDGSLVRVDSRIGQKLEAFVDEVAAATRMGRR